MISIKHLTSSAINVLALTGPIFMLQLYDRVISSRHEETLLALVIIAAIMYAFYGLIDAARAQLQSAETLEFERSYRQTCLTSSVKDYGLPERNEPRNNALEDIEVVRKFLASPAALVRYDIWWTGLFLFVLWAMHEYMLYFGIIAMACMMLWALRQFLKTSPLAEELSEASLDKRSITEAVHRNADTIRAMGALEHVSVAWSKIQERHAQAQLKFTDTSTWYGSISKAMRFAFQSGMLAVGAWLVIQDQLSAGYMIAGSIVLGRALAPIDIAIANAKNYLQYRSAKKRLEQLELLNVHTEADYVSPKPAENLKTEQLSIGPRGSNRVTLHSPPIHLNAGECLIIGGPSGSGKSTLLKALAGIWKPLSGSVSIDGVDLSKLDEKERMSSIGYLDQAVKVIDGSVAENISLFDPSISENMVRNATQLAGLLEVVNKLPFRFDTLLGVNGHDLSAGEIQRLGLARAVCHLPKIVFLDEPNSNLDVEGEEALVGYIHALKHMGRIVVMVTHRSPDPYPFDKIIIVEDGKAAFFNPNGGMQEAKHVD